MVKFLSKLFSSSKEYILVISGWWARWAYALGIMKWLEELWLDKNIKAVYGVSAGAIVGSYRAAGYSARETYEKFIDLFAFGVQKINLLPKKSLLRGDFLKKTFSQDLPANFEKLQKTLYIGATDAKKAEYILFNEGELIGPLIGSMSIPGIFEPIAFKNMLLMDWWTINNFPVDIAKKKYPQAEIIGIALNKFQENQPLKNIFDTLTVWFEILLRGQTMEKCHLVDHLFYRSLSATILDTKEKDMRKIFQEGYFDCLGHFKK